MRLAKVEDTQAFMAFKRPALRRRVVAARSMSTMGYVPATSMSIIFLSVHDHCEPSCMPFNEFDTTCINNLFTSLLLFRCSA